MNRSFEQNRQQIQQTHEIINVIEQKLNRFLEKRGVKQSSPESYKGHSNSKSSLSYLNTNSPERAIEVKLSQMENAMEQRLNQLQNRLSNLENENQNLSNENQVIHSENQRLRQAIRDLESHQKRKLDEELELQRLQLQKRFELQVNEIGENAKKKLMKSLEQEDDYLNQYNQINMEKQSLQNQLEQLRSKNKHLQDERNELAESYQNLLQMHNQMLKMDVSQNQNQMKKLKDTSMNQRQETASNKSELIDQLNDYKDELDRLRTVNQNIQNHMTTELSALRLELERQRNENVDLIKEMSNMKGQEDTSTQRRDLSSNKDLNDLYKQVFQGDDKPQLIPNRGRPKERSKKSKSKSKSGSQTRREQKQKEIKKPRKTVTTQQSKHTPSKETNKENRERQEKIEQFERELKRLKHIVQDKIVSKRKKANSDEEMNE